MMAKSRDVQIIECHIFKWYLSYRRTIFTNENLVPNQHDTNEKQNHTKVIEIPEELRRLYESQTGHEINSIYFREPGAHVETSNTIREFVGSTSKEMSNTETETVFYFDFDHDYYEKQPMPGNYGDYENILSYLWYCCWLLFQNFLNARQK